LLSLRRPSTYRYAEKDFTLVNILEVPRVHSAHEEYMSMCKENGSSKFHDS
jgi:hypothetical protein